MIRSDGFYNLAWSVVEGCLNGCPYCYAKSDLTRRGVDFKPTYYPDRLNEPLRVKGKRIFCDLYTDLMGDFIPTKCINAMINVMKRSDNDFIIITKNPQRYFDFTWPDNVIFGVTVESPEKYWRAEVLKGIKGRKLASVEPILGDFTGYDFSFFDEVVIGGMIGGKIENGKNVNTIKHAKIYYKPNIRRYLK